MVVFCFSGCFWDINTGPIKQHEASIYYQNFEVFRADYMIFLCDECFSSGISRYIEEYKGKHYILYGKIMDLQDHRTSN